MYCLVDPKYAKNGELTAQSDTYFFYNLETLDLDITWTEWLSDGAGGEYAAPYDSVFHYKNVTFFLRRKYIHFTIFTKTSIRIFFPDSKRKLCFYNIR